MSIKNTGKDFEKTIGEVYAALTMNDVRSKVELDVNIESKAGTKRQIDVLVTSEIAGMEIRTVIEAKDWTSSVPVDVVDGLVTKMRGINAHKGVIVSKAGFQSGTIAEAKQYDIDLCTAQKLSDITDSTEQIPVVVHFIPLNFLSISASLPGHFSFNPILDYSQFLVNGVSALSVFREELFSGKLQPRIRRPLTEKEVRLRAEIKVGSPVIRDDQYEVPRNLWEPERDSVVQYSDPVSGYLIPAEGLTIKYDLIYEYYFGYLNDLKNSVRLDNISTSKSDIFYRPEELLNFQAKFKKFSNLEEIAVSEAANFHCIGDIDVASYSETFQGIMS